MEKESKIQRGNKLKAAFNVIWDEALKSSGDNSLSYRDMARIKDAISCEGPKILDIDSLPDVISNALDLACQIVDPDEVSQKDMLKSIKSIGAGSGGVAILILCLGQILNPGILAAASAFIFGGIAAGPMAVFGAVGGLTIFAISVRIALKQNSAQKRAVVAHKLVSKGIDVWMDITSNDSLIIEAKSYINIQLESAIKNGHNLSQLIKETISKVDIPDIKTTGYEIIDNSLEQLKDLGKALQSNKKELHMGNEMNKINLNWIGPYKLLDLMNDQIDSDEKINCPGIYLWIDISLSRSWPLVSYVGKSASNLLKRNREHYLNMISAKYSIPEEYMDGRGEWYPGYHPEFNPDFYNIVTHGNKYEELINIAFKYTKHYEIYFAPVANDKNFQVSQLANIESDLLYQLKPLDTYRGTLTPSSKGYQFQHNNDLTTESVEKMIPTKDNFKGSRIASKRNIDDFSKLDH